MSDSTIATALRDTILERVSPVPIPIATLATQANPGDTLITLTSIPLAASGQPRFCQQGMLTFKDAAGEETLPILSVDPVAKTITLDFNQVGYAGLKVTHLAGTLVMTNLLTYGPANIAPMLAQGDPCLYLYALSEQDRWIGMPMWQPTYRFLLAYHRSLYRPDDIQINPNLWNDRQQTAARSDLENIAAAYRSNHKLTTNAGTFAEALGEKGNTARAFIEKDWQRLAKSLDSQVFACAMTIVVRDRQVMLTPGS